MSDLEPVPDGVELARGESDLALAARQLRSVPPARHTVEIADRVLQLSLATPRRSRLVRAAPPYDYLRVSTLVITAVLREHLDAHLVGAAVGRVVLDVTREHRLTGLTIELYVQFGTVVLPIGEEARRLAREALTDLLGASDPGTGQDLVVALTHVHVSDVTVGDPHVVDPIDE